MSPTVVTRGVGRTTPYFVTAQADVPLTGSGHTLCMYYYDCEYVQVEKLAPIKALWRPRGEVASW